jgi:hypothetical protein
MRIANEGGVVTPGKSTVERRADAGIGLRADD